MLTLNIIPDDLKKEIKLHYFYKSFKKLLLVIFLCVSVYTIPILLAKLILQSHFIDTISQTTILTKNSENYTKNVRTINNQLTLISGIQQDYIEWSKLIAYIAQNTKDGIAFKQLQMDKNTKSVTLIGQAATRDDLISLKEILENQELFSEIVFPIKNLLEEENINFEISVKLNGYDFSKLKEN